MHDARIFALSNFGRKIGEKLDGTVFHVPGDSAYTLNNRLITPYRDNGNLSRVSGATTSCVLSLYVHGLIFKYFKRINVISTLNTPVNAVALNERLVC